MLKLIIFDWDDVFTIGSTNAYHACYIEAARLAGSETSAETIKQVVNDMWGRPHEDVIKGYLLEPNLFTTTNEHYEHLIHTDTFLNELRLVEGSVDLLHRLAERYKLAIVSGIHPQTLQRVFAKFEVPELFASITTSYDLADRSRGKPHPDMVLDTLATLQVPAEEALCVGDAPGDIKMAQSAGVIPVAVLTGQLDRAEATTLGVPYIIEKVTDLDSVLELIK